MQARVIWCGLVLFGATGCSSGGNQLALFPTRDRLLPAARLAQKTTFGAQPAPRELAKEVLPSYVVEPGDVLLVQPADLGSPLRFPGDQPVLLDGTINLGQYGRVLVAGYTVDEIESIVRAHLEPQVKAPDTVGPIVVRLISRVSKVFYVLGEVNAPGSYVLSGRETVLDAILVAGGLTDDASRRNIILSRPTRPDDCRAILPICYNDIVQLGDTSTNYQIAPGDRIFVASKGMLEGMFKSKSKCPPCCSPQVPCSVAGQGGGACQPCISSGP